MTDMVTDTDAGTQQDTTTAKTDEGKSQENTKQHAELQARIQEFEQRQKQLNDQLTSLEKERNTYLRERDQERQLRNRDVDSYRGLQRSTTEKLQRLAELERQVEANQATDSRLARMEALIEEVANTTITDDDARRRVDARVQSAQTAAENARLKAADDARRLQDSQPQQQARPQLDDPAYRKQLFSYYFPDATISADHPDIDWAFDAPSPQEWFRRAGASIRKLEFMERENNATTTLKQQAEAQLAELRQTYEEQLTQTREQLEEASKATARREEKLADKEKGVDRTETVRPEGARKVASRLLELDEDNINWRNPAEVREHQKKLRALRDQALTQGINR
jgi:hypothetical protein